MLHAGPRDAVEYMCHVAGARQSKTGNAEHRLLMDCLVLESSARGSGSGK